MRLLAIMLLSLSPWASAENWEHVAQGFGIHSNFDAPILRSDAEHPLTGNYVQYNNHQAHLSIDETGHITTNINMTTNVGSFPLNFPNRLRRIEESDRFLSKGHFYIRYYYPYFPNTVTCQFPMSLIASYDDEAEFLDATFTSPDTMGLDQMGRCYQFGKFTQDLEFQRL